MAPRRQEWRHHSNWGQCPQCSWMRGTGGYKIIRRSNSLRFLIYSIIIHYKHRVPPTCTNWGGTNFFAHQFTVLYPIVEFVAPPLFWDGLPMKNLSGFLTKNCFTLALKKHKYQYTSNSKARLQLQLHMSKYSGFHSWARIQFWKYWKKQNY